jgi:hypothetical protein
VTVSEEDRAIWRELCTQAEATRPRALYWLRALRAGATPKFLRDGGYMRLGMRLPIDGSPADSELAGWRQALGQVERRNALRGLETFLEAYQSLALIARWLDHPRAPLDANARRLVETRDWNWVRWAIAQPERLLAGVVVPS